ncbi:hypothetical protein JL804_00435 [Staphylococcus pseudintermedius]|nr:hypothetical protein [Staphylococcus pseudintermedius]MCE5605718.1 hypothetical protein [Staphylococcus pseudintermedius]MCE5607572.1 hypothetical protein [Staphylococcus pseudintermedius]MCE5612623.1 hypothetical protein [Staphylococcus pseudintermedius]MCE5706771.1 hypothetical protein [Staphylococcus pseudintermedius]
MKMDYLKVEGMTVGIKVEYEDKIEREVINENRDYLENLFDELIEDAKKRDNRTPAK